MTVAAVGEYKLKLSEKLGYAMGDAGANLVWRGALAFLSVFYTDVLGISAVAASLLILLVRLSDGITDIIMGMIADRTNTKMGKFRPYILWSTPVLGLFMVLCFTTPDLGPTGRLIWAYVTYIGLTLAYTVNNVPYSALMGVMTPSHSERNILSSWRFFGAFMGGALITGFLPDLKAFFGGGNEQQGYQYTMFMFAVLLVVLLLITVYTTKERVVPKVDSGESLSKELGDLCLNLLFVLIPLSAITLFFYYRELYSGLFFIAAMALTVWAARKLVAKPREKLTKTQSDFADLISNVPWWILLAIGFLFMMFNGIKQGTVAYYFKYYIGDELLVGKYFIALLVVSMVAALCTGYLSKFFGKKNLFIASLALGGLTTGLLSFVGRDQVTALFVLGCVSEVFAAIMPVLFFSMLGDAADFSEWKNGRRATGLFFAAGTFINKTGGGFGGALILLVLAGYGYDGMNASSAENALDGMKWLMSWIPAGFAFLAAVVMMFYPLNEARMNQIEKDLTSRRSAAGA
jgi:glycoside/pentoside/hexuronide:cation symporter, GPH family